MAYNEVTRRNVAEVEMRGIGGVHRDAMTEAAPDVAPATEKAAMLVERLKYAQERLDVLRERLGAPQVALDNPNKSAPEPMARLHVSLDRGAYFAEAIHDCLTYIEGRL